MTARPTGPKPCRPGRGKPGRGRTGQGISAAAVRVALLDQAEDLFHAAFGPPVQVRARDWRARENAALAMCMRGPKRGLWMDHSADVGGDLMDLVALVFCGLPSARADFPRVLEEAARFTGISTRISGGISGDAPQPVSRRKLADTTAEDARQQAYQAALIDALRARARPIAGSRAAAYLAARGITHLPDRGLNDLPPVPGLPVRDAHLPALVVWATTKDGMVCGGQRILLRDDGRAAEVEVKKPSFGRISGCPARFPPALGASQSTGQSTGQTPRRILVIAEGPETALAIRQSCGCETWAVFGASCWKSAPLLQPDLPPDMDVILAPDRDAPKSPASRAFTRAVTQHLGQRLDQRPDRHCRFRIAEAPEPEGSKRDLNDTLLRAGDDALRAAIAGAVPADGFLRARKRREQKRKESGDARR